MNVAVKVVEGCTMYTYIHVTSKRDHGTFDGVFQVIVIYTLKILF